ncbi:MAG: CRISPR-associated endonuclease Cas1 [Verrucomicrobia bacterium]|nr:CRISPR-associated endonuclease Cas1 [Verrucomicrobiota bacterium]
MLNEFVYCPRLFYYEFVEGVFVQNADTRRGAALHARVDSGKGELPPPEGNGKGKGKMVTQPTPGQSSPPPGEGDAQPSAASSAEDVIHSRSVQLGSDRLGVTAKLDLVEVRHASDDLFSAMTVCPVDYKAGAPRSGDDGNEVWDADKMQLGLQILVLRDNGYPCAEGIIYYRATKQRVRLGMTAELEAWIIERIAEARRTAAGAIPPPLVNSPKCPRCSLVTVCLPDETRLLAAVGPHPDPDHGAAQPSSTDPPPPSPRRLIAPRDDARALYLNTPGLRIGRKDELLQVKDDKTVLSEVRINDVSHVALFGNIQISTQAIQTLCEAEVPVTYFSMGGWFYGITRGHELKNVFLRIEQFRQARDAATCLRLARQFVHGKIRNHRTLLMRNHLEAPPATLLKLKQAAETALDAGSLDELLGIEGLAAAAYFAQFGGMLKVADELADSPEGRQAQAAFNFNFTRRNRRPPTDPVNALLSLAYSLLAKDCTLAALAVGFDPYVGFFHQPRFGRPALALDLMEEFRPLVAESTVLHSVNNRVVTPKDFVRAGDAVNLSAAGRRRFFELYEQRMGALLTHPVFDYKVSYRRAIELQARLLAKTLTREMPAYVPLTTR